MKIMNLKQGSPEWLAHRRQYMNASEASIMMSASPNVSRDELLHMKATGLDREFSDWFQKNVLDRGHEVEAQARPIAEQIIGEELYPISAVDDDGWLAASYDGQTMLGDINWECKQWNKAKAAEVAEGKVPECDYWQLQHQLAVNPGSKTLYMVTDGTEENTVHIWVEANEADIKRMKDGWKQFEADLAAYVPKQPEAPAPEGRAPDALPALSVQVTGMVTASNLAEFEAQARATLANINTDLQTDEDFANAEKTVKYCKEVESRLDATKESVLGQMQTVDEVVRSIDSIKEETRQIRLKLDKAVKQQKESRKLEILTNAKQQLADYIGSLSQDLGVCMPDIQADFAGAMKGKKTIKSLESAANDELAKAKLDAKQIADVIAFNLQQLAEHGGGFEFLFPDIQHIATKPADDFAAVVKSRIAEHKEAEARRVEAERERIRREEEARAQREAQAQIATHRAAEQKAQAPDPRPQAATKPAAKRAPTRSEIIAVLCAHFGADSSTVMGWIEAIQTEMAA
ncbi:YqaJ viral recombinase family protein [Marinobacter sp.]|uniref:YqaJ viral recombinase family protein n=1 Tax=Marinobacter sp. TaxID=50741 RepID=UPI00356AFFEF